MKHLRTISLVALVILTSYTSVTAQVLTTTVTQRFTVNATGWNKVFNYGDPVTVFAYKQNAGTHSFGIYSEDYAGIIDTDFIPFDVQQKQLKRLPKGAKKALDRYSNIAKAKAREKALVGKYKTIVSGNLYGDLKSEGTVSKNDSIIIIGYKTITDFMGTTSYYAVVNNKAAGVFHAYADEHIVVVDVPLFNMPSTDDPQVKAIIEKEKERIIAYKEAEKKARKEEEERLKAEERRITAERNASEVKAIKEEELAFLRNHAPAYIDIEGWTMDSAGGIAVDIAFKNGTSQKVKYVYFNGYFLNAVGDKCRNEINGSTEWKCRGVGPVNALPDSPYYIYYDHIAHWHFCNPRFYSTIAKTFRLSSVTIEYMNGKKTTVSGAELKKRVRYM